MSSPAQKRGSCGHAIASFDGHAYCTRCRDKGKGEEPCISNKEASDCKFCNAFTPEQRVQLATQSYKLKKEKREAKRVDNSTPTDGSSLVDPASVSVIGVVGEKLDQKSPTLPPEKKKTKKDKASVKAKKSVDSTATDRKISELDSKWSEHFNRLEALIMSKSFQPTFSSDLRVTTCSPPDNVPKDSEPFFQPTHRPVDTSPTVMRTDPDSRAAMQPSGLSWTGICSR